MTPEISLRLPLRRLHLFLIVMVLGVAALGAISEIGQFVTGNETFLGLGPLVDLDYEGNLPDWHLSMLMLFCAALLAIVGHNVDRARRYWLMLAAVLLFLSADHLADIDDPLTDAILAQLGQRDSVAALAWIAVAIPIVWLAAVTAGAILRDVPWRIRWLGAAAMAAYGLSLAVGDWEYPLRLWFDVGGREGGEIMVRDLLGVLAHALRTLAVSLLCSALFELIAHRSTAIELRIAECEEKAVDAAIPASA